MHAGRLGNAGNSWWGPRTPNHLDFLKVLGENERWGAVRDADRGAVRDGAVRGAVRGAVQGETVDTRPREEAEAGESDHCRPYHGHVPNTREFNQNISVFGSTD